MKLSLLFLLIDLVMLLIYPIFFLAHKIRQIFGFKR